MPAILELQGLTKHFRSNWTMRRFVALDGLELAVPAGEVLGLIGPNGAGKTTTFKLVLGLLRPTRGTVLFRGKPLTAAARAAIGFLPEQPYFYDYLTVQEMLTMYGGLQGLHGRALRQRVTAVIDEVQLGHKRRAALRSLSKGTLQRVGIAQAIIHDPELLILDEPMSGLDPIGRRAMRELIRARNRAGASVIFSSHILPDAEALCDRVAILTQGRVREVIDLHAQMNGQMYQLTVSNVAADTLAALERLTGNAPSPSGTTWGIRLSGTDTLGPALELIRNATGSVDSVVPVHSSLEERFLSHIGHAAHLD